MAKWPRLMLAVFTSRPPACHMGPSTPSYPTTEVDLFYRNSRHMPLRVYPEGSSSLCAESSSAGIVGGESKHQEPLDLMHHGLMSGTQQLQPANERFRSLLGYICGKGV